jgi:type VI secretion system ImpC/EvpB family protein
MNQPLADGPAPVQVYQPSQIEPPTGISGLLAEVLAASTANDEAPLPEQSLADLARRLGRALGGGARAEDLSRAADVLVAKIERLVERQTNEILHHPRFQSLEASWRGVRHLCHQAAGARQEAEDAGEMLPLKLKLLHITKREVERDLSLAVEFDQSKLFKFIYEAEFGTVGGEPYGAILADYQFTNHRVDVETLGNLSQVAAAAFAPIIAGVSPQFFQLDDFDQLERGLNLERDLQKADFIKWRALRERVDTRFLALTLPRVLMRLPYEIDSQRADGFRFHEDVAARDSSRYLWGNAAYAFGSVLIRSFAMSGWFADIRGFERGIDGGGLVTGMVAPEFSTDAPGIALKGFLEVAITGPLEKELSEHGFLPLCALPDSDLACFYTNPSIYKTKTFSDAAASANEKLAAMLQYVLCSSRFAHYLKRFAQDKIGSFNSADELEALLSGWIRAYVTADERASPEIKARYPLRQAEVHVVEARNSPGNYQLVMELLPHYQLDDMAASLRLVTRLATAAGS